MIHSVQNQPFSTFTENLTAALKMPLPGYEAQYKMAREFREHPKDTELYHANARLGAVLILLYPKESGIHTVLIQRPAYEGVHSAQIAFPGGKKEDDDESLMATALREAEEEVGIIAKDVVVAGTLTHLYIPPSNFLVTPVVGICNVAPALIPQETEVAEIVEVGLSTLMNDNLIDEKTIHLQQNISLKVKYYDIHGKTVWGATAMMIAELKELLYRIS
jgi:8-oxo-dGTP pyrophosphatase MutT (NUDIX family)